MNLKHKACTLFFLLLSMSASLYSAPTTRGPAKMKAFMLDTKIWRSTRIPVCWENYAEAYG